MGWLLLFIQERIVIRVEQRKPRVEVEGGLYHGGKGNGVRPDAILWFCLTQRGAKNEIGAPWPGSRELKSRVAFITSSRAAITVKRSSTREINPICQGFINTQNISRGSIAIRTIRRSIYSSSWSAIASTYAPLTWSTWTLRPLIVNSTR